MLKHDNYTYISILLKLSCFFWSNGVARSNVSDVYEKFKVLYGETQNGNAHEICTVSEKENINAVGYMTVI